MFALRLTIILFCGFGLVTQPGMTSEKEKLSVSPTQCIVSDELCDLIVNLSWNAASDASVCLRVSGETGRLICGLPAQRERYHLRIETQTTVEFQLLDATAKEELAKATLRVLNIPKRVPRQRAAWSLF